MKVKKILAWVTSMAMVLSSLTLTPMNVMAADQVDLDGVTISSNATVNYIDASKIVRITVPTSEQISFSLDPQNLAATQGVGVWNPSGGGAIIPQSVTTIVNKGAMPVKASVSFALNDEASTKTTLVDTITGIDDGTTRKMMLTLTPASKKTSVTAAKISTTSENTYFQSGGSDKEFTVADLDAANIAAGDRVANSVSDNATFGQFVCKDDSADAADKVYYQVEVPTIDSEVAATTATTIKQYNAEADGYACSENSATLTESGAELAYVMNKADYYVTNTDGKYALKYKDQTTNTNYDTASFIIGGSINKNADWSVYDADTDISLAVTYSFETMTETDASTALADKLAGSYNSVATTPVDTDVSPTYLTEATKTIARNLASLSTPIGLGTGAKAVTVSSVTLKSLASGNSYANMPYQVTGGNLVLTSSANSYLTFMFTTAGNYEVSVKTSDNNTDKITITVQ